MSEIDFEMESGVDLESTSVVSLNDPVTGEPWHDDKGTPVTVTVFSAQGDTFRQRAHAISARYRIKAKNNAGPTKGSLTFSQEKSFTAEIYAAAIADWHLTKKNGGPKLDVPCTPQNAVNWAKANPLFAAQLSSGTDELANFAKDFEGNFTSESLTPSTKRSKAT